MPKTASAIKSARQANDRRLRLLPYKSQMKTMMRKITEAAKAGNKEEAAKLLPLVQKSIAMAEKKNLIHRKTADRKKSLAARLAAAK